MILLLILIASASLIANTSQDGLTFVADIYSSLSRLRGGTPAQAARDEVVLSCAAPKRRTVYEALNQLFTCLVETRVDGSALARRMSATAGQPRFGRIAGSGATQDTLLAGLYSTAELAADYESHRLFYDLARLFPPELGRNESRGAQEAAKIDAYLSHLERSGYIVDTYRTLRSNDALPAVIHSLRDFVRVLMFNHWFKPYGRQAKHHRRRVMDSSGFGHVFVGEFSPPGRSVTGFHNWLSVLAAEETAELQYQGFVKVATEPLLLASIQFSWLGRQKPLSSLAFGVDTEFQMALFTACFVAKPGRKANLLIKGKPVAVQTYVVNHQKESIASAYFVI